MLVVLPFCAKDKALAIRLAEWIEELGGVKEHDCLLTVHSDTDSAGVMEPLTRAFGRCAELIIRDKMDSDRGMYQYCANIMWKRTAQWIADMKESGPWVWLEPDAEPLPVPDGNWLGSINSGYRACGKPFMLDLIHTRSGTQHNSGVGVYPARVRDYTQRLWQLVNDPWDVFFAPDFMPHTHHGPLIHDNVANPDPSFPDAASLSIIRPGAVLFHRDKSGELIQRLREARGGQVRLSHFPHKEKIAGSNPAPATLRTIYTYCEPLGQKWDDPELTELCAESWKRQGWKLVILTDEDARKHPLHDSLMSRKELHSPGDLHDYINACWRRWLAFSSAAMTSQDGIWTCDLDTINFDFTAEAAGSVKLRDTLTLCNDSPTPCMTHGTFRQYEAVLAAFLEFANAPHTTTAALKESISDQNVLDHRRDIWTGLPMVVEYLQPGCDTAALVHYAFARCYFPGRRGAEIKKIRPLEEVAWEYSGSDRKVEPKIFSQNLLPKDHIAALVVLSEKDAFAKGRIIKQLKAAGFELAKAKRGNGKRAGRKTVAA